MPKNFQIDLVELFAPSPDGLKKSTKFFNAVFGWNYKVWGPTYSDTPGSGITSSVNGNPNKHQTSILVVIYAEDLEGTQKKIIEAGGKIVDEISPFPGGRRFHFTDPSGNELAVWSDK